MSHADRMLIKGVFTNDREDLGIAKLIDTTKKEVVPKKKTIDLDNMPLGLKDLLKN